MFPAHTFEPQTTGGVKPVKKKLGAAIKERREALGMTQEQLAKKAGTTQQSIANLETGKSRSTRKLVQIAKALGVRAETLEGFASTDYAERLYEMMENEPPEQQEKAFQLVKLFLGRQ